MHALIRTTVTGGAAALCLVGAAHAADLDQEQPVVSAAGGLAISGPSEQKLAQVYTAGRSGFLDRIELPIGCSEGPGMLHVAIHEVAPGGSLPGTPVGRHSRTGPFAARDAAGDPVFRSIPFGGVRQRTGDLYAIVVTADPDLECSWLSGPGGDPYPGGDGWFDARPNRPGWIELAFGPDDPADLPFRTFVADRDRDLCRFVDANGVDNDFVPAHVPLCGCLEDPVLRSLGCRFVIPEAFLEPRIPLPFGADPGEWALWSLLPLDDALQSLTVEWEAMGDRWLDAEPMRFAEGLELEQVLSGESSFAADPEVGWARIQVTADTEDGPRTYQFEVYLGDRGGLEE
jgi:hypothetical protein